MFPLVVRCMGRLIYVRAVFYYFARALSAGINGFSSTVTVTDGDTGAKWTSGMSAKKVLHEWHRAESGRILNGKSAGNLARVFIYCKWAYVSIIRTGIDISIHDDKSMTMRI